MAACVDRHGARALGRRVAWWALWLTLSLALAWPARAADAPVLTARVTDLSGTLSTADLAQLEARTRAVEQRKGTQLVVLIVPSTDGEDIASFALKVAERNRIGRQGSDDGVLLLVAKLDRRIRIEVGYGLEGAITDLQARRVIDEYLTPRFRAGDFVGGLNDAVDALGKLIEGEPLPPPMAAHDASSAMRPWFMALVAGVFIGFVAGGVFSGRPSRVRTLLGAAVAAFIAFWVQLGWFGVVPAAVCGAIASRASRNGRYIAHGGSWGGGWGGGSSSGGWGGSSSGGGGWSGGGGRFGGGGASGGW
jgi:uncharacterized protein